MSDRTCRLDARPQTEFEELHQEGAVWFPTKLMEELSCALPPRDAKLIVVCSPEDEERIRQRLVRMEYTDVEIVTSLLSSDHAHVTLRSSPVHWNEYLWRPNPLIESCIEHIEGTIGGPGVVLDIGCGTCRDDVYLANRGWHCIGLDNRAKLLKQAVQLATHHRVVVDVARLHMTNTVAVRMGSVDLVHVCRFLHRPLLPALFRLARVGGFVVYNHFLDGCQHTAVGTPSTVDGYLLHNELENLDVVKQDYKVVTSATSLLPDGRPVCHFVALRLR